MKLMIIGAIAVIVVILLVWVAAKEPVEQSEKTTVNSASPVLSATAEPEENQVKSKPQKLAAPVDVSDESEKPNSEDSMSFNNSAIDEPMTPHSIESAMDSMRQGLAGGDDRTPPLREPQETEQPTLEELNDPELYQEYELRQTMNKASAYYSSVAKELPELRAKIAQAKQDGSRTDEEIQEAEEALQKLEQLKSELESGLPEDNAE